LVLPVSSSVIPPSPLSLPLRAPALLSTLSLHDALPISARCDHRQDWRSQLPPGSGSPRGKVRARVHTSANCPAADSNAPGQGHRSEEHTSELQSRENLVCRLLLEKKNKRAPAPGA